MAFKFPFTNYHELNLDWILKKVEQLFNDSMKNVETINTYEGRLTTVEGEVVTIGGQAQAAQQIAESAQSVAVTAQQTGQQALALAQTAQSTAAGAINASGAAMQEAQAARQEAQQAISISQNTAGQLAGQMAALQTESVRQQQLIEDKGAEILASLPADYTDLAYDVEDLQIAVDNLNETVYGGSVTNFVVGKNIDRATGNLIDADGISVSDKIPYTWTGSTRYYTGDNTITDYGIAFYSADDTLLGFFKNPSTTGGAVYRFIDAETQVTGTVAYVRFSFLTGYTAKVCANVSSELPVYWTAEATTAIGLESDVAALKSDVAEIKTELVPDYGLCLSAESASLSTDDTLTAATNMDIRKNNIIEFHANIGSLNSLTVGHGYQINNGTYLVVDGTNMTVYNARTGDTGTLSAQQAHGLTLSLFINVIIDRGNNGKANIELTTGTGQYRWENVAFSGARGSVFALCDGTLTNAKLTAVFKDFNTPYFFFGDSYMSMGNVARWPYYLVQNNWIDFLASGFPGADGSTHEILSFRNIIEYAKPKVVVWCLGMNGSVTGNRNAITEVITTCDELGIEVVLSTTPCVPDTARDNVSKNNFVKSTGKRYIDFAKAVGAETLGSSWYAGMLSDDNIHPTSLGAKALYSQVLKDFPEIMR